MSLRSLQGCFTNRGLSPWSLILARSKTLVQNRIREFRLEKEAMTQQDLAHAIGVTRQTVNAIEGGKYSPSLEVAFRIAKAFSKPLEEVFQFHEAGE